MKTNRLQSWFIFTASVGVSVMILGFFIGCTWIGYEAKRNCQTARQQYGGDCVEALTVLLSDDHQSFRARNNAIWALGQLGDSRALSTLQGLYTGVIPEREPLDQMISQYELKKAIELTSGGTNISAFLWRDF